MIEDFECCVLCGVEIYNTLERKQDFCERCCFQELEIDYDDDDDDDDDEQRGA